MPDQEPDNKPAQSEDTSSEQETLEKIIQRLQEQGKLSYVPASIVADSATASVDSDSQDATSQLEDLSTAEASPEPANEILSSWDVAPTAESSSEPVQEQESGIEADTHTPGHVSTDEAEDLPTSEPEGLDSWGDWQSPEPEPPTPEEKSIVVSRKTIIPAPEPETNIVSITDATPWTLQQFFDGDIDLDIELQKRFTNMPLLVSTKFRTLGSQSRRRVATLSTSDGSASMIVDADMNTKVVQFSFTFGSMLTLRFHIANLNDMDRSRWLELMRREQGGLAFLWGPTRWQEDYLICISRQYATNLYAFSPNNFEAAIRLTPSVIRELLDWLDAIWNESNADEDSDAPMLTW